MKPLTPKQKEYLDFIRAFKEKWGLDPRVSDFVKAGFGSRTGIRGHLWALREKDKVEFIFIDDMMRGVRIKGLYPQEENGESKP